MKLRFCMSILYVHETFRSSACCVYHFSTITVWISPSSSSPPSFDSINAYCPWSFGSPERIGVIVKYQTLWWTLERFVVSLKKFETNKLCRLHEERITYQMERYCVAMVNELKATGLCKFVYLVYCTIYIICFRLCLIPSSRSLIDKGIK